MKKEEIVKALEVCSNYQGFGDCDKCPAREGCDTEGGVLEREALSLIREQDKRIEEIKAATVRKMADRLKTYYGKLSGNTSPILTVYHIDQIAKEILEET